MPRPHLPHAPLRLWLALLLAAPGLGLASARAESDGPLPAARAPGAELDGRGIYDRVLANRFESMRQRARLVSGDRAGNEQVSRMEVLWQRYADAQDDVLSKAVVRYTHPFDVRHSAYLVIDRREGSDPLFVYLPSRRRVQRVTLRGQSVLGSDFSVEDVLPAEIDEASYVRLADAVVDGVPCQVVEVRPEPDVDSEYERFQVWVDAERAVVLRARYWDRTGVAVKELQVPAASVRNIEGVHVAMQSSMHNLQSQSYTHLELEELIPNPEIPQKTFDPTRLETH